MDSYLGEIKLWALNFAPKDWHLCDGALLPVAQNQALFSLLGAYYGGDGRTNFALPDLRGRVPVAAGHNSQTGANLHFGDKGGTETTTLTQAQTPPHNHAVNICSGNGNQPGGLNHHIAAAVTSTSPSSNINLYTAAGGATVALDPATISTAGSATAHENMQPYLALNYYICTAGLYPMRP